MDDDYDNGGCFGNIFRTFVCVTLLLLLGLQVYSYWWGSQDIFDGDFSDIKYVVTQLTQGLSEVTRKHEKLQGQMERISAELPAVVAAADRAKEALEPARRSQQYSLETRDYDRQLADYALETAGARIIDTGDTIEHVIYESAVGWALYVVSSLLCRGCPGAAAIIRPGNLPGECWAFKGSKGEATIRLLETVRIKGISVEHIPAHISPTRIDTIKAVVPNPSNKKSNLPKVRKKVVFRYVMNGDCRLQHQEHYQCIAGEEAIAKNLLLEESYVVGLWSSWTISEVGYKFEISSAPRLFQLEGLESRLDQYPYDFGTYEYNKEAKPIQYFEVHHPSTKAYNLVRFRVLSNWGHTIYTCVYRIRVHGDLAPGQPPTQTLSK